MVTAAISFRATKGARAAADVGAGVAAVAGAGVGTRVGMGAGLKAVRVAAKGVARVVVRVVVIRAGTDKVAAHVSRRVAAGRWSTSTACRW